MSGGYSRDISSGKRIAITAEAATARKLFLHKRPRTADQQKVRERQKAKRYLIKGRRVDARTVWDVLELNGDAVPVLVGQGFMWQEEAIAFSRDRIAGRIAVGFSGVRGLFRPGAGGVLRSETSIELPGSGTVKVTRTRGGLVVE